MSKSKKTFVIILSIAVVMLLSIAGTLAYLLSEAEHIDSLEVPQVAVELRGVSSTPQTLDSTQVNNVPKDPVVYNSSKAPAYIRAQVLVNGGHLDVESKVSSIVQFEEGDDWDWSLYPTTGYVYYKANDGVLDTQRTTGPIFKSLTVDPNQATDSLAGKDFDVQINVSAVQSSFYPPLTGTTLEKITAAFDRIKA